MIQMSPRGSVGAAPIQQRRALIIEHPQVPYPTNGDGVVAGVELIGQLAVDVGENARQHRRTGLPRLPSEVRKLVNAGLRKKVADVPAGLSFKMLMQKWPLSRSLGQLTLVLEGHSATKGGSNDSEAKDCAAKPAGIPSRQPVAITTPVANCPNVSRNSRPSN